MNFVGINWVGSNPDLDPFFSQSMDPDPISVFFSRKSDPVPGKTNPNPQTCFLGTRSFSSTKNATSLKQNDKSFTNKLLCASEITANLYCNCVHLYEEGCVIFSTDLR